MARPPKCRCICSEPRCTAFAPQQTTDQAPVQLSLDEYETIRLLDYEKLSQEQCAARMQVSRTTVTRIYEAARGKMAEMLVSGRPLEINGGDVQICRAMRPECRNVSHCCHRRTKTEKPE